MDNNTNKNNTIKKSSNKNSNVKKSTSQSNTSKKNTGVKKNTYTKKNNAPKKNTSNANKNNINKQINKASIDIEMPKKSNRPMNNSNKNNKPEQQREVIISKNTVDDIIKESVKEQILTDLNISKEEIETNKEESEVIVEVVTEKVNDITENIVIEGKQEEKIKEKKEKPIVLPIKRKKDNTNIGIAIDIIGLIMLLVTYCLSQNKVINSTVGNVFVIIAIIIELIGIITIIISSIRAEKRG